jgi:cytochrome c-type biogenesis protein CcsB
VTEKVLLLLAIVAYAASAVLFAARVLREREWMPRWARRVALTGLALHAVAIALRWRETGHGPYVNTYEVLSSDAWVIVAGYLLLEARVRWLSNLGVAAMSIAFLMMGAGLMGSDEVRRLPPTLQSSWLVVHIAFAKLTVASIALASALGAIFLLKARGAGEGSWLARTAPLEVLDDWGYRLVAFGFIALTNMIIAGAIWANASWGSYWSWDPTETWSLVVWFVYGLYLHGRVTFGWRGRVSAGFVIGAFAFSVVAFFVLPYFVKGQHSQYMTG